jgi:hypothetical protein
VRTTAANEVDRLMEIDLAPTRQDTRLTTFVTHAQKLLETPVEDVLFHRFPLFDVCRVHAFLGTHFTTRRRRDHRRSG